MVSDLKDDTSLTTKNRHDSGRIRGYAHIDFPNEVEATNGLKRDGYMMGTRCVYYYYSPLSWVFPF